MEDAPGLTLYSFFSQPRLCLSSFSNLKCPQKLRQDSTLSSMPTNSKVWLFSFIESYLLSIYYIPGLALSVNKVLLLQTKIQWGWEGKEETNYK